MPAYRKGTTPEGLLIQLRENFAELCAAIQAQADPEDAWRAAVALGELIRDLEGQSAAFKGWLLLYYQRLYGVSQSALADMTARAEPPGVSRVRVNQMMRAAEAKGNPVSNATTAPLSKPIILAVVVSDRGVLVERRKDRVPPYTFPGGEMEWGESPDEAAKRKVFGETAVRVTDTDWIDERIHPRTGRHTIYVKATVDSEDIKNWDPDDLDEVMWMSIADTREHMPDMHQAVRTYLNSVEAGQAV